ncbi:unnamed protein product, partial [Mesorhabditis spiculigera]
MRVLIVALLFCALAAGAIFDLQDRVFGVLPLKMRRGYRKLTTFGKVKDCPTFCQSYHRRPGYCTPTPESDACTPYCGCGAACKCR